MIELRETEGGTILPVRAAPAARRDQIAGQHEGMLKVCVTQAAEKGKANKAIAQLLASALGLRKGQVTLLSGATARDKRFLITGISLAELKSRLDTVLAAISNGK